jgi:Ca2+-binding EF-hand superfamily protein
MPILTPKEPISPQLKAAFERADADGNEGLEVHELQAFFADLGVERNAKECQELIERADVDGDEMLSLEVRCF